MAQNQRIVQQRRKRIDMKRYLILFTGFLMIGCGRKPIDNIIDNSEDSINLDRLNDTLTPTMLSSLSTLIDTLYGRVQSKDITTRINAQYAALHLGPMLINNYLYNTQIDTALLSKMVDKILLIEGEWYIEQMDDRELLSKEILYNEDIFQILICINEQSNECSRFIIAFPKDTQSNLTLFFSEKDLPPEDTESTIIRLDKVLPADSIIIDNGQIVTFCNPKTIDYFLNNAVVYIGYINNNEDEEMENRFEIGRLLLARFQEQYNEIIQR